MNVDINKKTPISEQDPAKRAGNFYEVCLGYNEEEARAEANRCINCKNPRCVEDCPVGVDIPGFIMRIKDCDFSGAFDTLKASNALPAVCGRVCPQESQCEGKCVRGIKGEPVAIGKLERFAADLALASSKINETVGNVFDKKSAKHRVAVIGAGPAGLTCAGELAKAGVDVTIFEALHKAGGVLVYGIPEFRLPKEKIVQAEVDEVLKLGVTLETNVIVGKSVTIDELLSIEGFSAVFIGSGAGLPKFMDIEGEQALGVFSANEYLTRANLMNALSQDSKTPIMESKKAVIIGGGNVAMDAARTAKRLGADTYIVYRRSEEEMPARIEEIEHAKEEGIKLELLTIPVSIRTNEGGWVSGIECVRCELGEPDASGRRSPVKIADSNFIIDCDMVVVSLGTSPNPLIASTTPDLKVNKSGGIIIDEQTGATSKPKVYAGGDAVSGAATVILAMGAGKAAAKGILDYLKKAELA